MGALLLLIGFVVPVGGAIEGYIAREPGGNLLPGLGAGSARVGVEVGLPHFAHSDN